MSEHKYLPQEELDSARYLARECGALVKKFVFPILDDLDALRAELKRTRAELKDAKSDAAFFEERMAIHSAADREQISQLTRERDEARGDREIAVTQKENVFSENEELRAEIARLREENKTLIRHLSASEGAERIQRQRIECLVSELDRMRKALEEINGEPSLDEIAMRETAYHALNPQPAQPAPVAPVSA